ncbi:helix-turn-helix domain-containing protein [Cytophagaceae bacterium DM2B3-1]|uniref:Helix-turn-helix domain-containing protein n=2 Tax=Xanthocytophaga TaxID=3078918 RepID=A0ABT7CTK6_9BACT|nr:MULTISPECIES: helix-turn-helix domain-containing protein [Xanthocytophaga]MDJ1497035.1 helix-turn-helix domain-containing protein [Xanthocytophaga flavus]MDJ1501956.1 helix-turn-helix domain-containing protein [Xanthocytophaga agilis]
MENWKAMLLLVASCQGILLSLALLTSFRKRIGPSLFLGLILLIISLELLNDWAIQIHYHQSPAAIPFWLLESYLIIPPSLYFFILSTTRSDFQFTRKHLLLYVPAVAEIIMETAATIRFRLTRQVTDLFRIPAWFFFTEILPVIGIIAVLIFFGKQLRLLSKNQKASSQTRQSLIKLYSFFATFLLLSIFWIADAVFLLPVFPFEEGIMIVFLFTLAYTGYSSFTFFDTPQTSDVPLTESETQSESPLFPNYNDRTELARMENLLKETKLYTQPKLSLEDLANALHLPSRYVSYLINTYRATNFHSFINTHRVEEVLRKINDPAEQHKTLLALALESGFNSKSSFNQVFKLHTGQTPSTYLPKIREKV